MFKFNRKVAVLAVALSTLGVSANQVQAQTYSCSDATYGSGGTYSEATNCDANNTSNQSSTVTTSTAVLKAAASQTSGMISDRVATALDGGSAFQVSHNGFSASTGMAAGDHAGKIGAWAGGSWSSVEDDNASTEFDGNVYSGMVGIDYRVTPKVVVGLSLGYESTDIDTVYNGFGGQDGNIDADGYTIAPYVGYKILDNVSANLTVGYSDLEYDTSRYDPNTGNKITGTTDAQRYFVNASVQGDQMFQGNWHARGKVSVFYASEEKDAFTETESTGSTIANSKQDTDFGQASLDAKVGYVFDKVETYGLVGLEYDFTKDEAPVAAGQNRGSLDDSDFGAKFGAGLDFQIAPNITGGFEGYTVEFRDDYSEYTFTGGLRVQF